jgi:hypothetical protein
MKASFINKSSEVIPQLTYGGIGTLNFLARCRNMESNFAILKSDYEKLNSKMNLEYRQAQEEKQLLNILNGTFMEKIFLDFPGFLYGKSNNLFVNATTNNALEWEKIKAYPVYSYDIDSETSLIISHNEHTSKTISMNIENSGSIIAEYNEIPEYTLIHAKLNQGSYTRNILVDKNKAEIVHLQYKNADSWQFLALPEQTIQGSEFPIEIFEDYLKETIVIVKNKKVNNNYTCQANILPFSFQKKQLISDVDLTIEKTSGLFLSNIQGLMENNLSLYFDGHVIYKNRRYDIQIPTYIDPITRLELVSHRESDTIFRCTYPVDINNTVTLFKSLKNSDVLEDWQVSLTGLSGSWVLGANISTLDYSTQPLNKARYLYFRINGYLPTAYISYQLYTDVGSSWPLSEDGNIFYNGTGIGFKENNKVRIVGSIYGNRNVNTYDKFPIAMFGVD